MADTHQQESKAETRLGAAIPDSGWLDKRTLAEQVYQHVYNAILSGELVPGREIREVRIAQALGMSRGPVREAIGRLRAEGLVRVEPRRGTYVSSFTKQEFEDAYQVREALEVLAVKLASPIVTGKGFAHLNELIEEMATLAVEGREGPFFNANSRFHRLIVEISANGSLLRMHDGLAAQMGRYRHRSALLRGDLVTSVGEHRAIVAAMRDGDADAAAALMSEHIQVPLRGFRRLTDEEWERLGNRNASLQDDIS